jgi:hypothetical protein
VKNSNEDGFKKFFFKQQLFAYLSSTQKWVHICLDAAAITFIMCLLFSVKISFTSQHSPMQKERI